MKLSAGGEEKASYLIVANVPNVTVAVRGEKTWIPSPRVRPTWTLDVVHLGHVQQEIVELAEASQVGRLDASHLFTINTRMYMSNLSHPTSHLHGCAGNRSLLPIPYIGGILVASAAEASHRVAFPCSDVVVAPSLHRVQMHGWVRRIGEVELECRCA